MKFFDYKKSAFTLMEISLVILVLSILVILSLPIINKQLEKSNEYAYFMAYKTVEKLGSQIVAYGDSQELTALNDLDKDIYLAQENSEVAQPVRQTKLGNTIGKIQNMFTPKAVATPTEITSWSEYEYNIAKLCMHSGGEAAFPSNPIMTEGYGGLVSLNYLTLLGNWANIGSPTANPCTFLYGNNILSDKSLIVKRFTGRESYPSDIASTFWNNTPKQFCESLNNSYISAEYRKFEPSQSSIVDVSVINQIVPYDECILKTRDVAVEPVNSERNGSTTPVKVINCSTKGFVGASYNSDTGECECQAGAPSLNNNKVCCPPSSSNSYYYSYLNGSSYECVNKDCRLDRYNEITRTCCPAHSKYSLSSQKCVCDDGYRMNASNICQVINDCQPGTHMNSSGICVANAPISRAKRFCELIEENLNIQSKNCNTFTKVDDVYVNRTLFNNVTVNNTFMSINTNSKAHVFRNTSGNMTPNIVFSNGLKMWILGDKQASIAGLSFNPNGYSVTTNVCRNMNIQTAAGCGASNANARYFCQPENQCFDIKRTYENNPAAALKDARDCCATLNLSDIINQYTARGYLKDARTYAVNGFTIFVDIDGDKGEGTLWEDVFPFYVSANGKVIPGYPLDAQKTSSSKYIGGNSSALMADVYYYDTSNNARKRVVAYSSIPYARALCFAREISAYTPYCLNLGTLTKDVDSSRTMDQYINSDGSLGIPENPCFTHRCFIHVKNKLKFM